MPWYNLNDQSSSYRLSCLALVENNASMNSLSLTAWLLGLTPSFITFTNCDNFSFLVTSFVFSLMNSYWAINPKLAWKKGRRQPWSAFQHIHKLFGSSFNTTLKALITPLTYLKKSWHNRQYTHTSHVSNRKQFPCSLYLCEITLFTLSRSFWIYSKLLPASCLRLWTPSLLLKTSFQVTIHCCTWNWMEYLITLDLK